MSARAIWKASLRISRVDVPVKLYAAVEDRDVHFRLLDAKSKTPVQQQMIDPRTREAAAPEDVRRGVEVERGVFVLFDEAELGRLAPEPSREIEVVQTVPAHAVDPGWYLRPYFLGPDASGPRFAALVQALEKSGLCAIARWTMRGQRYAGAIAAAGDVLALTTLRSPAEVVAARDVSAPTSKEVSAAERKLAEQLIAALDAPFDPADLHDEHRERLRSFLEAKARGRKLRVVEEAVPRPSGDLQRALERSVAALKKKRVAA